MLRGTVGCPSRSKYCWAAPRWAVHLSACVGRGFGFSSSVAGSIPKTCSHIHCCTPVSWSQPYRTDLTQRPRSSP
ncbi:hypothetical protein ACWF95_34875 [Streptomyces vinaceus]